MVCGKYCVGLASFVGVIEPFLRETVRDYRGETVQTLR